MKEYEFTQQAEVDLFDIWSFIAKDSLPAADRVESEIYATCRYLAENPLSGHKRMDLTESVVRFWTLPRFRKYMVVYDPNTSPLRIIRILHSALDITRRLE